MIGKTGTDSVVVNGLADGVDAASPVNAARVLADVPDAHFQERAVLVVATAGNAVAKAANASDSAVIVLEAGARFSNLFALYLWIALEARWTRAESAVIAWLAVCVNTADVWQAAHVVALAVDAGFLVGAVVVMATALYAAVVVTDESM